MLNNKRKQKTLPSPSCASICLHSISLTSITCDHCCQEIKIKTQNIYSPYAFGVSAYPMLHIRQDGSNSTSCYVLNTPKFSHNKPLEI